MSDGSLNDFNWDHWQTIRLHPSVNVAKVIDAVVSAGLMVVYAKDGGLSIAPAQRNESSRNLIESDGAGKSQFT
jgi:hypothetical protein